MHDETDELLRRGLNDPLVLDPPPSWEEIRSRAQRRARPRRPPARRRRAAGSLIGIAAVIATLGATAAAAAFLLAPDAGKTQSAPAAVSPADEMLVVTYGRWSGLVTADLSECYTLDANRNIMRSNNKREPRLRLQRHALSGEKGMRRLRGTTATGAKLRKVGISRFYNARISAKEEVAAIDARARGDAAAAAVHLKRAAAAGARASILDQQAQQLSLALY